MKARLTISAVNRGINLTVSLQTEKTQRMLVRSMSICTDRNVSPIQRIPVPNKATESGG